MRKLSMLVVVLAGCPGKDGGVETLVFEDANNFAFTGNFTIEPTEIEPQADFCIDWSGVTVDIRDRPFDPTSVTQAALLQFDGTQAEVLELIDTNQLVQADAAYTYTWAQPGGETSACASDFEIIGNAFDTNLLLEESDKTWVVSLTRPGTLLDGDEILLTVFVTPTTGSTNNDLVFTDTTASLAYTVDVAGKPALQATATAEGWVLDWSAATTDVNGAVFDPLVGNQLLLAHYDQFTDVSEVEDVFLRLDTEASTAWALDVFGKTDADLAGAATTSGDGFTGFTTEGVWLAAIVCSSCTSPVPQLLAHIEVK